MAAPGRFFRPPEMSARDRAVRMSTRNCFVDKGLRPQSPLAFPCRHAVPDTSHPDGSSAGHDLNHYFPRISVASPQSAHLAALGRLLAGLSHIWPRAALYSAMNPRRRPVTRGHRGVARPPGIARRTRTALSGSVRVMTAACPILPRRGEASAAQSGRRPAGDRTEDACREPRRHDA